jgi:putative transposase
VRSLCERLGIGLSTGYKWRRRYIRDGETKARSRRPKRAGRGQAEQWRGEVLALWRRHRCGAAKLWWYLKHTHGQRDLPAVRTVHRWLRGAGLVRARRRRAPAGPVVTRPPTRAARQPNAVWSVDFKGEFCTQDGTRVNALTITDVYSHYLLAVDTVSALSTAEVKRRMTAVFHRYGLPRAIRVDHGAPFHGPGTRGWTQLSVWWVRLGIRVEFIHLNGNASHEQMHRMLKERTASPPARTLTAQRARFAWWKKYYNHDRPHEGAQQMPPATRYRPSERMLPLQLPVLTYPRTCQVLQVNPYGYVYWRGQKRSIGRGFARERIGVRQVGISAHIYLGSHRLGILLAHEPALRPLSYKAGRLTASPASPLLKSERGRGQAPSPAPHPSSALSAQSTALLSTM